MALLNLILILLVGGVLAWFAESWKSNFGRVVSLITIAAAAAYLWFLTSNLADGLTTLTTDPTLSSSWLIHTSAEWIPRFGINLELAMDGISLIMVALTLFLGFVAVISSWSEIDFKRGFFQANLLWTLAGVVGVFLSMDLFLFFVFWEVMLVPMYLLIAIWGHEGKAYAAMKFFIFTQVSGLLMLFSIMVLVWVHHNSTGVYSFSYFDLLNTEISPRAAFWLMLGFFLAFTVKLPGFPFHTWLPDAHTQAPTAGSVILAGILLKTGAYGLIRFTVPLFPQAALDFAPIAMGLGVTGVIYGAVLAFAQNDFKRLIAYSSVSHMGFVLLGVFAWNQLALHGALMQMVAHGLSTAALFMIAGALQQRLHTRDMREMSGLWHYMPKMGAIALFFAVASLGLPGLGNFVAEFLVLLGLFKVNPWLTALAALGLITAAAYSLIMMQKSFQGAPRELQVIKDFGALELTAMGAMMIGLIWLGVYPQPVFDLAQPVFDGMFTLVDGQLRPPGLSPVLGGDLTP